MKLTTFIERLAWVWDYEILIRCCCLVAKSCPTLCDPMDCNPRGSSDHRIFQARILEWVAISFCRGSSPARVKHASSALADRFFTSISSTTHFIPLIYNIISNLPGHTQSNFLNSQATKKQPASRQCSLSPKSLPTNTHLPTSITALHCPGRLKTFTSQIVLFHFHIFGSITQ